MRHRGNKGGTEHKCIPLIGKGFLCLIGHLFWHLPFSSPKQATQVREKFHVTEEEWDEKWLEIAAEHDRPDAAQQLLNGWKKWMQEEIKDGVCDDTGVAPKPMSTKMLVVDD